MARTEQEIEAIKYSKDEIIRLREYVDYHFKHKDKIITEISIKYLELACLDILEVLAHTTKKSERTRLKRVYGLLRRKIQQTALEMR